MNMNDGRIFYRDPDSTVDVHIIVSYFLILVS